MNTIEESFTKLLGRQPTDTERQIHLRSRDAFNIKNNDALWSLLMVLGHYETLYAKIPVQIAEAAREATAGMKAAAEIELKAAATRTRTELAKTVAQSARDIANRMASVNRLQWIVSCTIGVGAMFLVLGATTYRAGYKSGDGAGCSRQIAQDRTDRAAAAWANSPEGRIAHGLADSGSIRELAACSGTGWKLKGHVCVPKCEKGLPASGWNVASQLTQGPGDGPR